MMWDNLFLGAMIVLHIAALTLNDLCALSVAKHVNSIARVLVDAMKLCVMWTLGKLFVTFAILPSLQERWKPMGPPPLFLGSWMMLPAMLLIAYGLLMYQKGVWVPLKYSFRDGWTMQSCGTKEPKAPLLLQPREPRWLAKKVTKIGLDDNLFVAPFRGEIADAVPEYDIPDAGTLMRKVMTKGRSMHRS